MRYFFDDVVKPIVIIAQVIFIVIFTLVGVTDRVTFSAQLASIERLRYDAMTVNIAEGEAVAGQAAEMNQQIIETQEYRKHWYGKLLNAPGWDDVTCIDIGRFGELKERP